MAPTLRPEIKALVEYIEGKAPDGLPNDLWGMAASIAAMQLLQDWQITMATSRESTNLVADVDRVIAHLQAFKRRAESVIPRPFGGHAAPRQPPHPPRE